MVEQGGSKVFKYLLPLCSSSHNFQETVDAHPLLEVLCREQLSEMQGPCMQIYKKKKFNK